MSGIAFLCKWNDADKEITLLTPPYNTEINLPYEKVRMIDIERGLLYDFDDNEYLLVQQINKITCSTLYDSVFSD